MSRWLRRGLVSGAVLALAMLSGQESADAAHFSYLAEREDSQGYPYDLNTWGTWQWIIDGSATGWCSEFTDPAVNNAFAAAIGDWESAFSAQFGTKIIQDCVNRNTLFKPKGPGYPCASFAHACVERSSGWQWNGLRGGYYRVFNIIWFNTDLFWTTTGYRAVGAHELGHVYGLDESYLNDNPGQTPTCNPNVESIMDVAYSTGHCDGLVSPTCCGVGTDKWRASDFYYLRPAVNLTSSSSARTMTGTWLDHNWTESKYRVYLEYCVSSTGACSYYSAWDHYQPGFLGQGDPYQSNVSMQTSWTKLPDEPRGYYRFCVATFSPVRGQQYYVCAPRRYVR